MCSLIGKAKYFYPSTKACSPFSKILISFTGKQYIKRKTKSFISAVSNFQFPLIAINNQKEL